MESDSHIRCRGMSLEFPLTKMGRKVVNKENISFSAYGK